MNFEAYPQVSGAEQCIPYDAVPVTEDARINRLGRLAAADSQLCGLAGTETATDPRKAWLEQSVETMVGTGADSGYAAAYTVNALAAAGFAERCDVLVAGRYKVSGVDNVGKKTVRAIDAMMSNEFGIVWLDEPTAADIAVLCASLSEVNSIVLGRTAVLKQGRYPGSYSRMALSVQDILDGQEETIPVTLWGDMQARKHQLQIRNAQIARNLREAHAFAQEFYAARRRMQAD